ncbi:MAG: methyltransferase domain-containing protein [Candidatus Latescibacteria bacterium]|nr:methyltransferase domain-containing protein [bacterium]MBD3425409.1 methyltransferase domain-containing protein [Candidatus Latescibacterota bacterium]
MAFREGEYDLTDPELVSAIDDLPIWSAPFGMKILEVVDLRRGINVLDIGCGSGFPAVELSQRLGHDCGIHCVDPWKEACDRLGRKIRAWGIDNIEVHRIRAEHLPFPGSVFDLVISSNGINNVDDDRQVISEISRVSRGGAQMVIAVNLPGTMAEFYQVFRTLLLDKNMNRELEGLERHIFAKRKPLEYTLELISSSGFTVRDIYRDSFRMRYMDGTAMMNNFFIRLAFLPCWKELINSSQRETIFRQLEAELNKVAGRQGCLTLTVPWVCIDARKDRE